MVQALAAVRHHSFGGAQRVLGVLLMIFSVSQLLPLPISFIYGDSGGRAFVVAFLITLVSGAVIWFPVATTSANCACGTVCWWWCCSGLFSACSVPYRCSSPISRG
jgi:Trk-type K+ transport system membrane component